MGAFLFIGNDDGPDGSINFTRSVYLSLNKKLSQNYTLPFDLYPGSYLVYVYDIESNGRLRVGINYPATMNQLLLFGNTQLEHGEHEIASK